MAKMPRAKVANSVLWWGLPLFDHFFHNTLLSLKTYFCCGGNGKCNFCLILTSPRLRFYKWKTNAKLKAGAKISQIYKYGLCQQSKIFSNMKYFALSKNRANIQMHRQQLQLPCQSRKCSYSWFCMGDWVGIFLQVELIYREYAIRSLHWFVKPYILNCIFLLILYNTNNIP